MIIRLSSGSVKLKTLNNNEHKFRHLCLHRQHSEHVSLLCSQVQRNYMYRFFQIVFFQHHVYVIDLEWLLNNV